MQELCVLENGDRSKNYPNKSLLVDSGVPFVNAGHLQVGRIDKSEMTFITEERFNLLKGGKFSNGDILFCLRGSLGKSAIVDGFERGAIASSLVIVRLFSCLNRSYFHNYFDSLMSYQQIKKYDNGTAQPNLSAADLGKFLVALPPENEQHRIVAKVDELMALCDQLENHTEQSLDAHTTLADTLLDALTQAQSHTELMENWARLEQHWDILFPSTIAGIRAIDKLKQTILQLAVMGKLVAQDPNDEPASELLKRIATEKAQLVKDKKIKKQKPLPPITDEEKPFELPDEWEWCRLQGLAAFENGDRSSRYPNASDLVDAGIPFFGATDICNRKLSITADLRFITEEKFSELSNGKLKDRDFVMLLRGSVGKTAQFLASGSYATGFINAQMLIVRLLDLSMDKYLDIYFQSGVFYEEIVETKSGAVIQQIPAARISELMIPVPPLEERKRIVAKVEELTTLCDQLKQRLQTAQQIQQHFTDSVISKVLVQ